MKRAASVGDMRAIARGRYVADLRDGKRQRATTIPDGKKAAARRACRGNVTKVTEL